MAGDSELSSGTCGLWTRRHGSTTPVPAQKTLVAAPAIRFQSNFLLEDRTPLFVKVLAFEVCFVLLVFVIKRFILGPCLDAKFFSKFYYAKRRFSITSKYRHMYGVLNVDEIKN
jgi:hypothetical protein